MQGVGQGLGQSSDVWTSIFVQETITESPGAFGHARAEVEGTTSVCEPESRLLTHTGSADHLIQPCSFQNWYRESPSFVSHPAYSIVLESTNGQTHTVSQ